MDLKNSENIFDILKFAYIYISLVRRASTKQEKKKKMKNIKKLISAIEKIRITDVENGESLFVHETDGYIILATEQPTGNYIWIKNFPRYAEWKQKYEFLQDEFEDGYIDEEEYAYQYRYIHYDQYGYTNDIQIEFYNLIQECIQELRKHRRK